MHRYHGWEGSNQPLPTSWGGVDPPPGFLLQPCPCTRRRTPFLSVNSISSFPAARSGAAFPPFLIFHQDLSIKFSKIVRNMQKLPLRLVTLGKFLARQVQKIRGKYKKICSCQQSCLDSQRKSQRRGYIPSFTIITRFCREHRTNIG